MCSLETFFILIAKIHASINRYFSLYSFMVAPCSLWYRTALTHGYNASKCSPGATLQSKTTIFQNGRLKVKGGKG